MRKPLSQPVPRRRFLIGAGATLAGAALACGGERGGAPTPEPPSTLAPTSPPTLAPTPASTPAATSVPTLAPALAPIAPPEQAADMVLVNGKVITIDAAGTIAQGVAIKDGLIHAVGANDDLAALVGELTQVVDLRGRAVTPGLICRALCMTWMM